MRVLVFSHGHPDLQSGGSELAAYALFNALNRTKGVAPYFLAAASDAYFAGQLSIHQLDERGREFLFPPLISDPFYFVGGYRNEIKWQLMDLIERLGIEVLHLHHFLGLGVDTTIQIRNRFPALKMVYTAHDFLPICAREGQMVRAKDNQLCYGAVPLRCALCVPQRRPIDFEIRREWFRSFFDCFQAVLTPAAFTAKRLAEWGVPKQKLSVVENLHPLADQYGKKTSPATDTVHRFGFFAPLTEYKGLAVLLDAAEKLRAGRKPVEIHIFGEFNEGDPTLQKMTRQRFALLGDSVRYHGGYQAEQSLQLMQSVDWVVVPSIWWENSPVAIEEALIAGRPVLTSNIGSMLEKVENYASGLHFPVGDAEALAETMARVAGDRALWERLVATRRGAPTETEVVEKHLAIYGLPRKPGAQAAA